MVIAGSASWSTKYSNDSVKSVEEYTANLTKIVDVSVKMKYVQ